MGLEAVKMLKSKVKRSHQHFHNLKLDEVYPVYRNSSKIEAVLSEELLANQSNCDTRTLVSSYEC